MEMVDVMTSVVMIDERDERDECEWQRKKVALIYLKSSKIFLT